MAWLHIFFLIFCPTCGDLLASHKRRKHSLSEVWLYYFSSHIIWSKAYILQYCFQQVRRPGFDPCFRRNRMSFLFRPAHFALLFYLFSCGVAVRQCPSTLPGPGSSPGGLKMPEENQIDELTTPGTNKNGWKGDSNWGPDGSAKRERKKNLVLLRRIKMGGREIRTWTGVRGRQLRNHDTRTEEIKQQSKVSWPE